MGTARSARGRAAGAAAVVVAAVAATLTVLWASAVPRPPRPISVATPTRTITTRGDPPVDLAPRSEIDAAAFGGSRAHAGILSVVLGWLAVALVVGAVVVLLAVLVRAVLRERRDRSIETDDAAAPSLDRIADALTTDADGRLHTLARGTPAEGIVAVWTRLEETLRTAGVPLPASRTSTETTVSALRRLALDEGMLRDLAALYREASWSRHPLTEADRDRAEACLGVLDRHLAAGRDAVATRSGEGHRG